MNEDYKFKNIKSIDDIKQYLSRNLEAYKEETKHFISTSDFNTSQKQDIEEMLRQYYYALDDIVKSIEIIANKFPPA